MKIGISIITNRPEKMIRFSESIHNLTSDKHQFEIGIVFQEPFDNRTMKNVLRIYQTNPKVWKNIRHKFKASYLDKKSGLTNICQARIDAFDLLKDTCDYILWCDDDFMFKADSACGYTSADRLEDCIQFMNENPSCGIVKQMGFLGGSNFGRKIMLTNEGYFDTALGALFRNEGDFLIPQLKHLGGCEEGLFYYTKISQGYGIHFAFNSPTRKDPTKKPYEDGDKNQHPNRNYSLNEVREHMVKAFESYFQTSYVFGMNKIPEVIIEFHKEAAAKKNLKASYPFTSKKRYV